MVDGWAGTGLSKDQEALIVPRRSGNLDRETLKRSFYSKCLACEYENNTTGAVGGGTQHAETHNHPILVVYYAEYKYAPSIKGEKAFAARQAAQREKEAEKTAQGKLKRKDAKAAPLVILSPTDLDAAILRAAQALGLSSQPGTTADLPEHMQRTKTTKAKVQKPSTGSKQAGHV